MIFKISNYRNKINKNTQKLKINFNKLLRIILYYNQREFQKKRLFFNRSLMSIQKYQKKNNIKLKRLLLI